MTTLTGDGGRMLHRPPRRWPRPLRDEPFRLAPPPQREDEPASGLAQLMLPAVGALSLLGFALIARSVAYLAIAVLLVVAIVGATVATQRASARRERTRRARAAVRYRAHVAETRAAAQAEIARQRDALTGLHPPPGRLAALALRDEGVWERRRDHPDFLTVRIGAGDVPARSPVVLGDAGPLTDPVPELADLARAAVEDCATARACPVTVPLRDTGVLAFAGPVERTREVVLATLAQVAVWHAPDTVHLAALVPADGLPSWEWAKWLPHVRPRDEAASGGDPFHRARCTVTDDADRFLGYVHRRVAERRQQLARLAGANPSGTPAWPGEHVVVVVDSWVADGPVAAALAPVLGELGGLGITVVTTSADARDLPGQAGIVVTVDDRGVARLRRSGVDEPVPAPLACDELDHDLAEATARHLAGLRVPAEEATTAELAATVRWVDLTGADSVGRLGPAEWLPDDGGPPPAGLLRVPVGRTADGGVLDLDLTEPALGGSGPHGLLVGATGSGKSELLRTIVAGLAARHSPALVSLVLIDYKGGAAFAGLADLPHIAGQVTNLGEDTAKIDRMQVTLQAELDRRQQLLRWAEVEDLHEYHRLRATRPDLPALPYLVVIVDEFGELLSERPELVELFTTVARIGRSLGLHLLLATQRLDEGRIRGLEAFLRYRICLRTFSVSESIAVLGSPAAFELPAVPGLGYLSVDSAMVQFKAALMTAPYRPPALVHERRPVVARPFTLAAPPEDEAAPAAAAAADGETDLDVLVGRLSRVDGKPLPGTRKVWLPPLPHRVSLAWTLFLAAERGQPGPRSLPVGLLDLPARQDQPPLLLDLTGGGGHVALVGAPRTGKTTFLATVATALGSLATPGEVQVHGLDFGGGGLHGVTALPHVGTVAGRHEPALVARVVRELRDLVAERADAFRRLDVSTYADYARLRAAGAVTDQHGEVFLLVDNAGVLRSELFDLEQQVVELAVGGLRFGVHVVLTANRWLDFRPALLDAVGTRLELRLNEPADSQVGRLAAQAVPVDVPGRGLTRDGEPFQLALPSLSPLPTGSPDRMLAHFVDALTEQAGGARAPRVTLLPDRVDVGEVAPGDGFLLGIDEYHSRPARLDLLAPGAHLVVHGDTGSGRSTVVRRAVVHLLATCRPEAVRLHLVDPLRNLLDVADAPHVEQYLAAGVDVADGMHRLVERLATRLPAAGASVADLRAATGRRGARQVLVVDDYELFVNSLSGGPFTGLADFVVQAAQVGLHVLLARRVAGSQRLAFEPMAVALRDVGATALLLAGDPGEGAVVRGRVADAAFPPGRGWLFAGGGSPRLVQVALGDEHPWRPA